MTACLQSYQHALCSLLPTAEGWPELHPFPSTELHISLSRTVPIMFHWIEPLTIALRSALKKKSRQANDLNGLGKKNLYNYNNIRYVLQSIFLVCLPYWDAISRQGKNTNLYAYYKCYCSSV